MPAIIGFSWYERSDYLQLRDALIDADQFPQAYESWLAEVENKVQYIRQMGFLVMRVVVKPPEFMNFCRNRGIIPDCNAHKTFLDYKLTRKLGTSLPGRPQGSLSPRYSQAIETIDNLFGKGHSAKDPDLVSAYLRTQVRKGIQTVSSIPWLTFPGYPRR